MTALKDARKRAGLTQTQVAEVSGIPLGTLRRWEQGVNEPNIDMIIQLADLYGVSTDELLGSDFASIEYDTSRLSDSEQHLVDLYRRCPQKGRELLIQVATATYSVFGRE